MKIFCKSPYLLSAITLLLISCGSDTTNNGGSKAVAKDTSEKKFDPAGYQKQGDTYDPKVAATDTMYKNKDSIPRAKQ